MLIRINARFFVAGAVLENNRVVRAAPIIGYMEKDYWTLQQIKDYCKKRHWFFQIISPDEHQP